IHTTGGGAGTGWEEQAQAQGVPAEAMGLAQGADFIVPPGFENDSFGPIFVQSGERVTVTPREQTTINNFNQTINSRATTEQSSGGFRMMQSMVG
ncbi:MAG: hypothetical protein GY869_05960, partial [Planctomycetes bacterium]|nr:hypothetical protein [Planctomycetota bacterium]